jgi:hypothetical protein
MRPFYRPPTTQHSTQKDPFSRLFTLMPRAYLEKRIQIERGEKLHARLSAHKFVFSVCARFKKLKNYRVRFLSLIVDALSTE